ncbi:MAG TPA: DegT/DnrJ/EryC1/StrS family aminotransferase [Gammaproteobacteria bacterium]|nr:DegT/DnrJ/EryC1/StrS family aminotransferase [Xanthomonadales bacterium]MCB1595511.1 DegT/DnrJ/EryC1/StrS family aminotransferase [Xanthomonadales bacterium]HOP23009.1 DegT/DnrJ/EryC1/StrS family aminotransferase [Gammaproteobacteria bacterium]HPI96776.1 DegT/DnrJ/EryC1/StrS family aminotransferase [Gammaproteobacteria bacterium]HPQ88205.1 DegT/DnrJ/EryC1/StrS family aminotransferase [Gammaproteobacteria bacterium]
MKYPLAKPEITQEDIDAVTQVLKSSALSRGPTVKEFEQAICQSVKSRYACVVSSGTAGLIMALQALGTQCGDEVITVSFTVPATVNSITAVGAVPVMIDIEAETLGMCPTLLQKAITNKTKAIIVVHAFGKAAQIEEIINIAKRQNISVIEDACEAIGNQYKDKHLGTFADIGVFAFYPNKQITSGEGGILVTNNKRYHEKFKLLRNHGRTMNGDLYDQISFGWNFRMSDINAALGLSQFKRLPQIIQKRQQIAEWYDENLKDIAEIVSPQFSIDETQSAWFVYVIRLLKTERDKVISEMQNRGIQCGRYFAPVHLQPYYRDKFPDLKLPVTEEIAAQCLALPFYNELSEEDVRVICDKLKEFIRR